MSQVLGAFPHLGHQLNCLSAAQKFFRDCYESVNLSVETLWVAHLNSETRCIHLSSYEGSQTCAPFPLKWIMREAIEHDGVFLLLAHNHPSGDSRPSDSDLAVTRRLCIAADAIDCRVLDHLIFAGSDCTNFRSLGLL
jgi:DNA repair protein RadC